MTPDTPRSLDQLVPTIGIIEVQEVEPASDKVTDEEFRAWVAWFATSSHQPVKEA